MPGKAIKPFFSTSLKTLSLRFKPAPVYRGRVFSITTKPIQISVGVEGTWAPGSPQTLASWLHEETDGFLGRTEPQADNPPPLICIPVPDLCQPPQGKATLFPQQSLLCTSGLGVNYQAHGGEEPGEAGGRPASGVAASHALFHLPSLRPGSLSLSLCVPLSPHLAVCWEAGQADPEHRAGV